MSHPTKDDDPTKTRIYMPGPGGKPFRVFDPNGDITDFEDRWAWIKSEVLDRWLKLSTAERLMIVKSSIQTLITHIEARYKNVDRLIQKFGVSGLWPK
jgi:hypothetical protein